MTTQAVASPDELSPIFTPSTSTPASGHTADIVQGSFEPGRAKAPTNSKSIDELISQFEADPAMADLLAEARREVVPTLYAAGTKSLTTLRLEAGLSQDQLAQRAGTYQSYIARVELCKLDPGTEMVARLATGLGIDDATVFQAIRNQRTRHG